MSLPLVFMSKSRWWLACLLMMGCLLLQAFSTAQAMQLTGIRTWSHDGTTRAVFDVDGDVDYQVFTLKDPARLVVDFKNTSTQPDIADSARQEALFKNIRWATRNGHDLRVVIDLAHPVAYGQFPLGAAPGKQGSRVVVDMQAGDSGENGDPETQPKQVAQQGAAGDPIADIIKQQQANAERQSQTPPVSPNVAVAVSPKANQGHGRDIVVIIDPGHGGKDPGTHGPGGTLEKTVVLQIGKRVKSLFDNSRGFVARMTRDDDTFVPLRGRTEIARKDHADFFVSVHADAAASRSARGSSVYALSQHGATSETARWLAQKENNSDLIGGVEGDLDLSDKDEMLRGVLLDLSMTATINASLSAGRQLIDHLGRFNRLHTGRVDQAGFVVLKSPDIPSLLVETGYLSNPSEERMLKSPSHQQQIAQAIFTGITSYFHQHPPPGTYLANQEGTRVGSNQYRVRPGDSLTLIAQRQGVTVEALKKANNLALDVVQAGQVLTIPKGN